VKAAVNPSPEQRAAAPGKRKSGVIVPHKPTWYQRLGALIILLVVRSVAATLRYEWHDGPMVLQHPPTEPMIFCFWHNRLGLCMEARRVYLRQGGKKEMAGLVSASRDGGFLAAVLECFRIHPVRGSSSRRGPQALLELIGWAERGYDLAITPDGPRGPRYVVQDGVMSLAQITGLPIFAFSFHAQWKICSKSWDQFQIPLPFSRCQMNVAGPFRIPREATDEQREQVRKHLEQTLREISVD
jgi:lysophospholipid acyltransferase (LPLAT)-like uncharacterized protein